MKWYQIENIKKILLNAKFINESQKSKKVGIEEPKTRKMVSSALFLSIFFFLLVAPFWLFSNMNPMTKMPEINQVTVRIGLEFPEEENVKTNSFILVELDSFLIEAIDPKNKKLDDKVKSTDLEKIVVIL